MDFSDNNFALFFSLLSLGFFGGFSHCVGMCGPLVLSQVSQKLQNSKMEDFVGLKRLSKLALLPYHFGRITTYGTIGLICFFMRKNLDNFLEFRLFSALLLLIAALFFLFVFYSQNREFLKKIFTKILTKFPAASLLITSFKNSLKNSLSGVSKILLRFRPPILIKFSSIFLTFLKKIFDEKVRFLMQRNDVFGRYFLGIFLGFLPCGMLYGAFAISSNFSSPFWAFSGMIFFGLATFPALFAVAIFGRLIFKLPEFKFIANLANLANVFLLLKMAFGLL